MPPNTPHSDDPHKQLRNYVLERDHLRCQWPGCGASENPEVLFIIERNGQEERSQQAQFNNGITLCTKHMDIVMLHEKTFAPLVYDLIQLVEFENDLRITEKTYKDILGNHGDNL